MTQTFPTQVDALIIGAGFSGLYMLKRLKEQGLSAVIVERGSDVGGTWYWNRYPGARCDVESPYYSYSFDPQLEQDWDWQERYPSQGEIQAYLSHVAERYKLRDQIHFDTTVEAARFDEVHNRWDVTSRQQDRQYVTTAQYCILATGSLSASHLPDIAGIAAFEGPIYHTGEWPKEPVDFTGQRVAVIGTGSSGIQAIPEIAKQAGSLKVFQRTPNFSVPAKNHPLNAEALAETKRNFPEIRQQMRSTASGLPSDAREELAAEASAERVKQVLDDHWTLGSFAIQDAFGDIAISQEANDKLAHYIHNKIDEIVEDPIIADKLKPRDHPVGSKRMCVDTDYYATFNRQNVELVDVRENPIAQINASGIQTQNQQYDVDAIVFATGFDAMTGAILKIDIEGRDGKKLREHWDAGPRTYLGLSVSGFPNLYSIAGPGSPSVLTNMVMAIEQHVEWIDEHIAYLRKHDFQTAEAQPNAEDEWVEHVNELADLTLMRDAASWYLGANVPGKPRVFMPYIGGLNVYRDRCNEIAAQHYEGFQLA